VALPTTCPALLMLAGLIRLVPSAAPRRVGVPLLQITAEKGLKVGESLTAPMTSPALLMLLALACVYPGRFASSFTENIAVWPKATEDTVAPNARAVNNRPADIVFPMEPGPSGPHVLNALLFNPRPGQHTASLRSINSYSVNWSMSICIAVSFTVVGAKPSVENRNRLKSSRVMFNQPRAHYVE
jgi:hypothetical protein